MELPNNLWKPDALILGPGGIKGFLELGALVYLERMQILTNVKKIGGVSVGAILGLLLSANFTSVEITQSLAEHEPSKVLSGLKLDKAFSECGLLSNEPIKEVLRNMFIKKMSFVPTLKQLFDRTGIKFIAVSLNVKTMKVAYFDNETTPDLDCIEAVMRSMNIPGIFQMITDSSGIYTDGALCDPYPLHLFDNGIDKVLGITILPDISENMNNWEYLARSAMASMYFLRELSEKRSSSNCKHLRLKNSIRDPIGVTIDLQHRLELICLGYLAASIFCTTLNTS